VYNVPAFATAARVTRTTARLSFRERARTNILASLSGVAKKGFGAKKTSVVAVFFFAKKRNGRR
jgi:hypothetical protein